MFCRKCGSEVDDNCLLCPSCQTPLAVLQQKEVIEKVQLSTRDSLSKVFKSPSFLAFALGLTFALILSLASLVPSILENIGFFEWETALPLIFSAGYSVPLLVNVIGAWKVYGHKKGILTSRNVGIVKSYSCFGNIMYQILRIAGAVTILVLWIIAMPNCSSGIEFISFMIVFPSSIAGVILFSSLCVWVYSDFNDCVDGLTRSTTYQPKIVSVSKFYVLAAFYTVGALTCLLLTLSLGAIDLISSVGVTLSSVLYLVFSAIFVSCANDAKIKNYAKYKVEFDKLTDIEKQTTAKKNEILRLEREEQDKIEQEARAREEEKARQERERELARERTKEQTQEMLMQQMILMMQQNMRNGNFDLKSFNEEVAKAQANNTNPNKTDANADSEEK